MRMTVGWVSACGCWVGTARGCDRWRVGEGERERERERMKGKRVEEEEEEETRGGRDVDVCAFPDTAKVLLPYWQTDGNKMLRGQEGTGEVSRTLLLTALLPCSVADGPFERAGAGAGAPLAFILSASASVYGFRFGYSCWALVSAIVCGCGRDAGRELGGWAVDDGGGRVKGRWCNGVSGRRGDEVDGWAAEKCIYEWQSKCGALVLERE